jgi:squalene-hopene/tetraprenyl-beta-curcumene cyclase
MAGYKPDHPKMVLAQSFVLTHGSITKIRVFSRIHLALFGLIDWKLCPKMPVALMQFPKWAPVNIYEFSSWARACIVPLLVIMDAKKTHIIQNFTIDELYQNSNPHQAQWRYEHEAGSVSFENLFVQVDKMLQLADQMQLKPLRQDSLKKCETYIREHLRQTEDIYPAMFYGSLALYSLNFTLEDADIQKALRGLSSFRVKMSHNILSETPQTRKNETGDFALYQQCCISPVWDTAWAGVAMLEAGIPANDERLKKSGKWLLEKQITDVAGDWSVKNPGVAPGGWSFQFQNKYYPDVDDTIEVLTFLNRIDLPYYELKIPIQRGLDWLLSMQCKNGGFAAFDKDNDLKLLNKLPFSDHGACLDPATVDITGRMIEFLIKICDFDKNSKTIQKAADFIILEQEKDGSFWGRWGVNYIYGTWCALEGLGSLDRPQDRFVTKRALHWLNSVQNSDGGFGESCLSYPHKRFIKLAESVPSQTAWALMGYLAAGLGQSEEAAHAADFLIHSQKEDGSWHEPHFTGTGFPGHFYLRYHGYRHYFPLLALAKYRNYLKK